MIAGVKVVEARIVVASLLPSEKFNCTFSSIRLVAIPKVLMYLSAPVEEA